MTANVAGFKFGGAAAAASSAAAADDAAAEALITAQIDGDVAQHLRHLSKRDPVTKLKALQALKALIPARADAELAPALPPWIYVYKKLIMDLSRTVRAEASQVWRAGGRLLQRPQRPQGDARRPCSAGRDEQRSSGGGGADRRADRRRPRAPRRR